MLNKALENERSEDEEEPAGERSQVKGVEEGGLCWMEASCTALELHTADAAVQVSYSCWLTLSPASALRYKLLLEPVRNHVVLCRQMDINVNIYSMSAARWILMLTYTVCLQTDGY